MPPAALQPQSRSFSIPRCNLPLTRTRPNSNFRGKSVRSQPGCWEEGGSERPHGPVSAVPAPPFRRYSRGIGALRFPLRNKHVHRHARSLRHETLSALRSGLLHFPSARCPRAHPL